MTSHVEEQVQARIAEAARRREQRKQQRAELAAARERGLAIRKQQKLSRVYCATCARLQRRGTYLRCPQSCGAALCRSKPHCGNTHLRQCPATVSQTDTVTGGAA